MKIRPVTLVLCACLLAGIIAIALIAPGTMEAKEKLAIELAATPARWTVSSVRARRPA